MAALLTYGHGTQTAERTVALLRSAAVGAVIDIRIAPGSRRNPWFARAELERWLPEAGIGYDWDKRLGGFRKPSPGNPDIAWREDMYRGYAEHMRGPEFLDAVSAVLARAAAAEAAGGRVAVMCSRAPGNTATGACSRTSPRRRAASRSGTWPTTAPSPGTSRRLACACARTAC